MFGADYAKGRMVTGVSLSHTRGLGGYAGGADTGRMTSAVTGLYPWVGFKASERVTVWTVAGYGAGGLLLDPGAGAPIETGLSMAMAAGGGRGELMTSETGFELAFKAKRAVGRDAHRRCIRSVRQPQGDPGRGHAAAHRARGLEEHDDRRAHGVHAERRGGDPPGRRRRRGRPRPRCRPGSGPRRRRHRARPSTSGSAGSWCTKPPGSRRAACRCRSARTRRRRRPSGSPRACRRLGAARR